MNTFDGSELLSLCISPIIVTRYGGGTTFAYLAHTLKTSKACLEMGKIWETGTSKPRNSSLPPPGSSTKNDRLTPATPRAQSVATPVATSAKEKKITLETQESGTVFQQSTNNKLAKKNHKSYYVEIVSHLFRRKATE